VSNVYKSFIINSLLRRRPSRGFISSRHLLEIWYNFKGNNLVEIGPIDDIKSQIASSYVYNQIIMIKSILSSILWNNIILIILLCNNII